MLQANAITYALLLSIIFVGQFVPKVSETAFRLMRPVSEGITETAFWVAGRVSGAWKKEPPIIEAVEAGDLKKAQQLVAKGVDVNQTNDFGFPALSIAAGRGDVNMTKLLLNAGANVNASSANLHDTALSFVQHRMEVHQPSVLFSQQGRASMTRMGLAGHPFLMPH